MTILIIGTVLLGMVLGRFFKVMVLIPAGALTLALVVASSVYFGHGFPRAVLEFVVLTASLQIGYVFGLLASFVPRVWQRRRKPRADKSSLPATALGATRRR